jgi:nicotinamidase-related amidase
MHKVEIRREIAERVFARRGRLHLFDALDPKRSALVVIDMQNAFVAPGAPMEVPAARADFEKTLQQRGIDTLLIAGTKTNVCCECTARDATRSSVRRSRT